MIRICLISWFYLLSVSSFSQQSYELAVLMNINAEEGTAAVSSPEFPLPSNALEALPVGILFAYYYLVQAQSAPACKLLPANAVYGAQAVAHQNIIAGLMNYFDRMQRCHGLAMYQYPVGKDNYYIDRLKNFRYKAVMTSDTTIDFSPKIVSADE